MTTDATWTDLPLESQEFDSTSYTQLISALSHATKIQYKRGNTHTHAQTNGSCWCGEQIKYLFPVSGECLDRAPLILSLWEPPVPWIILSLRALRQTGSHAPFCSMPRHQPTPSTPIFSDPPLHHRGRCAKQREREEVRDEGRREGGNKKTKWECTKMTVEMQCFLWKLQKSTKYFTWGHVGLF